MGAGRGVGSGVGIAGVGGAWTTIGAGVGLRHKKVNTPKTIVAIKAPAMAEFQCQRAGVFFAFDFAADGLVELAIIVSRSLFNQRVNWFVGCLYAVAASSCRATTALPSVAKI